MFSGNNSKNNANNGFSQENGTAFDNQGKFNSNNATGNANLGYKGANSGGGTDDGLNTATPTPNTNGGNTYPNP